MKKGKTKICVIGAGYWGKNIIRNLDAMGNLGVVCDSDAAIINERKKEFPSVKHVNNCEELLKASGIHAVVIATPAATHYTMVKKFLGAGKDVFVEKPLALTVSEGKELVKLAKEKSRILMVGHVLQYHPAICVLKDMIAQGELGKIRYIYSSRLNIGKLRTEENILWSFAPHDISVTLSIIGEEPVRITATGSSYLNKGIYDVTLTSMEFRNDVNAHIFVSWLHPFKEQKLVVVGSKNMAVFDDLTKEKLFIYPHQITWKDGRIPVAEKAEHYCVKVREKEPLREELEHFIDCISERKTPKTSGEEGLSVLRVLEQIEKAMGFSAEKPRASLVLK